MRSRTSGQEAADFGDKQGSARWVWWLVAVASVLWLLWMTQRPQHVVVADLAPLTATAREHGISTHYLFSVAGNVVVFMPLGLAVALLLELERGAPPVASVLGGTLVGAFVSAGIEVLQSMSASRFTDWRDLVLNTIGALLGAAVAGGVGLIRRRRAVAR